MFAFDEPIMETFYSSWDFVFDFFCSACPFIRYTREQMIQQKKNNQKSTCSRYTWIVWIGRGSQVYIEFRVMAVEFRWKMPTYSWKLERRQKTHKNLHLTEHLCHQKVSHSTQQVPFVCFRLYFNISTSKHTQPT